MKLIDKDAIVAEIERRKEKYITERLKAETVKEKNVLGARLAMLEEVLVFINTLEVKEVDYDKEETEFLKNFENANIGHRLSLRRCAKHFFELGLQASNPLTWKDIKLIWNLGDAIPNMPEEYFFKELLNRYKEKKGIV